MENSNCGCLTNFSWTQDQRRLVKAFNLNHHPECILQANIKRLQCGCLKWAFLDEFLERCEEHSCKYNDLASATPSDLPKFTNDPHSQSTCEQRLTDFTFSVFTR